MVKRVMKKRRREGKIKKRKRKKIRRAMVLVHQVLFKFRKI